MKFLPTSMLVTLLLAFFAEFSCSSARSDSEPVYNLTSGLFSATEVKVLNRYVDCLKGIPYGEAPLLFEKPVEYRYIFLKTNLHPFILRIKSL